MKIGLAYVFLCLFPWLVQAADPLEVTADKAFEWHRAKGYMVARGNAVVTKGGDKIQADKITAYLKKGSSSTLDSVLAEGNVRLTSDGKAASAQQATYDLSSGQAVLTGGDLTLTSDDQTVTATEKITYDKAAGTLSAIGNAVAVRGDTTLKAHAITAFFKQDSTGQTKLTSMEATGQMALKTASETLTATRGKFDAAANKVYAWGNVKIMRGQNTIEGDRAESDLTNKVSNIYANENASTPSRVRGVFYSE